MMLRVHPVCGVTRYLMLLLSNDPMLLSITAKNRAVIKVIRMLTYICFMSIHIHLIMSDTK